MSSDRYLYVMIRSERFLLKQLSLSTTGADDDDCTPVSPVSSTQHSLLSGSPNKSPQCLIEKVSFVVVYTVNNELYFDNHV